MLSSSFGFRVHGRLNLEVLLLVSLEGGAVSAASISEKSVGGTVVLVCGRAFSSFLRGLGTLSWTVSVLVSLGETRR